MAVQCCRMRALVLLLYAAASASAQTGVVAERIAGSLPSEWFPGDGGPATEAWLSPTALAFDRDGSLLIADDANKRIRRLLPNGTMSTVFNYRDHGLQTVMSIALDSRGNLYLSDSHVPDPSRLLRISGGVAETIKFDSMLAPGIALDAFDNLYITDLDNNYVWKRSPDGTLQKAAGNGKPGTEGEGGPALQASLLGPGRLAFDNRGNLLIADAQRVLRVNPDGTLVRLAGGGLSSVEPRSMAAAPGGSIYIASAQSRIWRWDPNGDMTIVAGTGEWPFSDGCAASGGLRLARFATVRPADLALDAAGRLYIADAANYRVRRIDPDGKVGTVAGTGPRPRDPQVLYDPAGIAVDGDNVYFTERSGNRVRVLASGGEIRTIAGLDSAPPGEDAACYPATEGDVLLNPTGLAMDTDGNLYIADTGHHRIRRRAPDGAITTLANTEAAAVAVDPEGNVYFIDSALRRILPDGRIETVEAPPEALGNLSIAPDGRMALSGYRSLFIGPASGPFRPVGVPVGGPVAIDRNGTVYLAGAALTRVTSGCNVSGYTGKWTYASALAANTQGGLYLADSYTIWRIPAIPLSGTEVPSPLIANPGVRNAASNLFATISVPSINPFHPPTQVPVNDSIAPGEIVRITGACMGPLEPEGPVVENGRLAATLQGTRVLVNGAPVPLLKAQSADVLALIPGGVAVAGATLALEYQGIRTAGQDLKVEPAVPGVFVTAGTQAATLNQDGTLNSRYNPAAVGSVVSFYLTGAGLMDPPLEDGVPATAPLPLALPVTVTIGGVAADVLYAGAAPDLVGVAQVNVRVPEVPAGDAVPVAVSIAGIRRDQRVTIAVN